MKLIRFNLMALLAYFATCLFYSANALASSFLVEYEGNISSSILSPVDVTLTLYSQESGGSALWTETQTNVTVSNGIFTIQAGSVTPFTAGLFDDSLWIGVDVTKDGNTTSLPREPFPQIPHTFSPGTPAVASEINANFQDLNARIADLESRVLGATVVGATYELFEFGLDVEVDASTPGEYVNIQPFHNKGSLTINTDNTVSISYNALEAEVSMFLSLKSCGTDCDFPVLDNDFTKTPELVSNQSFPYVLSGNILSVNTGVETLSFSVSADGSVLVLKEQSNTNSRFENSLIILIRTN